MSSDASPTNKAVLVNPIDSTPSASERVNACVVANSGGAVPTSLSTGAAPVSGVLPSADSAKAPDNVLRSAVMMYPVATRPTPDGEMGKRARSPDESEPGQPKLAKSASDNPPTATTVVQARPSTMASQIMLVPAGPNVAMPAPGSADGAAAASTPVAAPSMPTSTEPVPGAPAVALPQRQGGSAAGTPAAPILVNSATPRQLQPGQGGALLQAMAPAQAGGPGQRGAPAQGGVMVQAGVPAMGMVQGQPWGMWPVMMQAGPGGYPGMVMQWMPTAAMATQDGGLPVRVVCRGCGLVRFDVEGRRWVHNHRQGKGNKQYACNQVLCGCQKGQICPNKGKPHDPNMVADPASFPANMAAAPLDADKVAAAAAGPVVAMAEAVGGEAGAPGAAVVAQATVQSVAQPGMQMMQMGPMGNMMPMPMGYGMMPQPPPKKKRKKKEPQVADALAMAAAASAAAAAAAAAATTAQVQLLPLATTSTTTSPAVMAATHPSSGCAASFTLGGSMAVVGGAEQSCYDTLKGLGVS